ncbi:hypothetical protein BH23PLA1_BH23PLA1_29260 [soil metagenome]
MGNIEDLLRRYARFGAIVILAMIAAVQVAIFAGVWGGLSPGGLINGVDFVAYYMAGVILDHHGGAHLYDLPLQKSLQAELFPIMSQDSVAYYPYAPWLAVLIRPLAWLPYTTAFGVWLGLNLVLYVAAIRLAWGTQPALAGVDRTTTILVALSWMPVLLWLLHAGQVNLPIFAVAAAAACDRAGRPLWAGAALALATYKPTLLAPVLFMLLVAGRWRLLAGFAAGSLGLLAIAWAGAGTAGLRGFVRTLKTLAQLRANHPEEFNYLAYCDPRSTLELLLGHHPAVSALAAALMLVALAWLAPKWWRAGRDWARRGESAWAQALVWLPLLVPHLAVYDTTPIVPGLVLALRELDRSGRSAWPLAWPVGIVYFMGLISQDLAKGIGLQAITFALLWLALRVTRMTGPDAEAR